MNNEKCPKILWPWLILLLQVHITFCHNLNKRNLGQKETVFAVWSPLPPWGQRLFRVALRIHNFLRFQSLQKKAKVIMNILWNFRCIKFKWVFIKYLALRCPLFYVWSCGIAKKKSVNFLTRDLVFCPHTIKKWGLSFYEILSFLLKLYSLLLVVQENFSAFCYLISQKIRKYLVKSQKEIIQCNFIKVLATLFNIIRQKCAGCQVTYLPKIDALLLQKRFQTFWANDRLNQKGFRPCLKSHLNYYSLTRLTWPIHTSLLPSKWNLYLKLQFLA